MQKPQTETSEYEAVRDDPVDFQELLMRRVVNGQLRPRRLWNIQKRIARGFETHRQVSVKGCHASGKTDVSTGMALQFLASHEQGKVFVTAPTLRQVKTFISEIELKRQAMEGVLFPECSSTGMVIAKDHYLMGASSSRGVNIQGLHGSDLLIIVDESPGVEPDIWDAIEGIRSGGRVRILKLGNPVVPSGPFFEDFKAAEEGTAPDQLALTISAFDTPNLQGCTMESILQMSDEELDKAPRDYLISRRWVKEMYYKWGPNNPKFMARVLGQFPTQSSYAVFHLAWIQRAQRDPSPEELKAAEGMIMQVGIDVAGGGDDETVMYAHVEGIILGHWEWTEADPAAKIIQALKQLRRDNPHYRMGVVVVDIVGVGLHLAPRIVEAGFNVYGFQAGAGAVDKEMFANAKAEAYWSARDYFRRGLICGLEDKETRDQLMDIMYDEKAGRTTIESKKDALKKRGIDSPDRAEALIMSLMQVQPRVQRQEYGEPVVISQY